MTKYVNDGKVYGHVWRWAALSLETSLVISCPCEWAFTGQRKALTDLKIQDSSFDDKQNNLFVILLFHKSNCCRLLVILAYCWLAAHY